MNGKEFRKIRRLAGINVGKFAAASGRTVPTVRKYEVRDDDLNYNIAMSLLLGLRAAILYDIKEKEAALAVVSGAMKDVVEEENRKIAERAAAETEKAAAEAGLPCGCGPDGDEWDGPVPELSFPFPF